MATLWFPLTKSFVSTCAKVIPARYAESHAFSWEEEKNLGDPEYATILVDPPLYMLTTNMWRYTAHIKEVFYCF